MIDSEDYAPDDPEVQEKSDVQGSDDGDGDSGSSDSGGSGDPTPESTSSSNVDARIGQVDVDVQSDLGQNNVGYDVETYFEDSATLTVYVTDGEQSNQRSFEGHSASGNAQEFNDDINPPDSFKDDEQFRITFVLSVGGEEADRKSLTHTYRE